MTNTEELTVIWLDEHVQDSSTQTRLRCVINFLKLFTHIDDCIAYIRSISCEHFFVIVSGALCSQIISQVHDLPQVRHFYIFCKEIPKHELFWQSQCTKPLKLSGIYDQQDALYNQLLNDVKYFYTTHLSIVAQCITAEEKMIRNLTNETGAFMWFQIFIFILLEMPLAESAKNDLVEFARSQYKNNDIELHRIKEFDRTYDPKNALAWYTSDCFVYRILNKAIRTENWDMLFAVRFFIADIHRQLGRLHQTYCSRLRSTQISSLTVYRGQRMISEEFELLKALSVVNDGIVRINSFLSTTLDRNVALMYAGDGSDREVMGESILFEIKIDLKSPNNHPFADIREFSHFKDEQEILFSLVPMFTITDRIEQM